MTQLDFTVDEKKCTHCGACVRDCPSHIISLEEGALPRIAPEQLDGCIECQHCLAVCPTGAVSIFDLDPGASFALTPEALPTFAETTRLLRGRRSVRQYRPENVDATLLNEILATVANSPTGCNNRSLTFTLIDDRAVMQQLLEKVVEKLLAADQAGKIPESVAFLSEAAQAYAKDGTDYLFRGAPHLLLVSAEPDAPCPTEDVAIAVSYFELLAHTAGLGTVWCGMLKFILDMIPELKPLLQLPEDHTFYPIVFGNPAVHYARTVQRDTAATVRRLTL